MTATWRPLLAGASVGVLVAGFFLLRKMSAIQARGSAIQAGLMQLGETYANEVAHTAADAHMANAYGLTPDTMTSFGLLAQQLDPFITALRALGRR